MVLIKYAVLATMVDDWLVRRRVLCDEVINNENNSREQKELKKKLQQRRRTCVFCFMWCEQLGQNNN